MKRNISLNSIQLELPLWEETEIATAIESKQAEKHNKKEYFHFTEADFAESMEILQDMMHGRGAYLYRQVERELAQAANAAKYIREFETIRNSLYR